MAISLMSANILSSLIGKRINVEAIQNASVLTHMKYLLSQFEFQFVGRIHFVSNKLDVLIVMDSDCKFERWL